MSLEPVIGLEIHAELKTKTKMFCSCLNNPLPSEPNSEVCPVCTGHPGVLPVANKEAIRKVIKTALALNCKIAEHSKFDRKSYFYPDLPKNYQISQYDKPLGEKGFLEIAGKKIRITRIHLEEDTGRLSHAEKEGSLVDFNRAGIPLMELVTEPDITSAKEARKFAEELQLIFRYLDVSTADMEKGQMRIEANISLAKNGKLGTKVEIKNLNSFRVVERAIDYEIERQTEVLEEGKKVVQETRGWLDKEEKTESQRIKEEAHDYRYFPEPDLPLLHLDKKFVQEVKSELPELPSAKRKRFKEEYSLDEKELEIFVQNKDIGEYFEKVMSELADWVKSVESKRKLTEKERKKLAKLCVNYLSTDLQFLLKGATFGEEGFPITPENFAEFITLIYEGQISSKIGKTILPEMFKTGADPSNIIEDKGLSQITDDSEIEKIAEKVINQNPDAVSDFRKGKEASLQFLIGQLMKETRGKANPQMASDLLKRLLE